MTNPITFNYSFSANPAPRRPQPESDLFAVDKLSEFPLGGDQILARNPRNGREMVFSSSLIRRAGPCGAISNAQCGAVTFIQRFGSTLNLNLHLHMLAIDGVYTADYEGHPQFHELEAPGDPGIARLTASLAERIPKMLLRRGLGPDSDPEESDPLLRDQPWLAGLYAASVSGRTAFGPNAGRRVTRGGDQIDPASI